jgi:hypothetical protein
VGVHLNRKQAVVLLKELAASKLIDPSWISIEKATKEAYRLKVRSSQEPFEITRFCDSNNLSIEEQNGFWLISKQN